MSAKKSIRETLAFQDLTDEQKRTRGILGRLYGPCASIVDATRNGRKYSDQLWQNVFNKNDIVKQMFANGGIPMQLDHPVDREQTDSTRIAAMLPAPPKRDEDGHLICYVDLIDTPCGKIAYQLAKYGFKLGISSRGNGDLYTDHNGDEAVDPQTYDFTTFDLVLLPAVKDARLSMCESYSPNKLSGLKKALKQAYDETTDPTAKAVMKEQIKKLNLSIDEPTDSVTQSAAPADQTADKSNTPSQKEVGAEKTSGGDAADTSNQLLDSLKQAIRGKTACQKQILELKSEKAAADSRVEALQQDLDKYKRAFARTSVLASESKKLKQLLEQTTAQKTALQESLSAKDTRIKALETQVSASKRLTQSVDASNKRVSALNEQLTSKANEIERLTESYQAKLETASQQASRYGAAARKFKNQYEQLLEHYIDSKASMLNVRANDIVQRLDENFTPADIDRVCDELLESNLKYSKLPIGLTRQSKIRIQESVQPTSNGFENPEYGYAIDDSLLELAGLK